jgi:PTS system nitrogen regulatory IIA component
MIDAESLCEMIRKGGVITSVSGETLESLYADVVHKIAVPAGVSTEVLLSEMLEREKILSTAVGHGVAIPHPRKQLVADESDQRVCICFLEKPFDMHAPDKHAVSVLFVLLTSVAGSHLEILSAIASLLQKSEFKKILDTKPDEETLIGAVKQFW